MSTTYRKEIFKFAVPTFSKNIGGDPSLRRKNSLRMAGLKQVCVRLYYDYVVVMYYLKTDHTGTKLYNLYKNVYFLSTIICSVCSENDFSYISFYKLYGY